jgi:hypothetical protein
MSLQNAKLERITITSLANLPVVGIRMKQGDLHPSNAYQGLNPKARTRLTSWVKVHLQICLLVMNKLLSLH